MDDEPIGELHGGGPRTEAFAGPKAALARKVSTGLCSTATPVSEDILLSSTSTAASATKSIDADTTMGEIELRDIVRIYDVESRKAAREQKRNVIAAVTELGGDHRRYRRETAKATRAIISEIHSPSRVGALAARLPKYACAPGIALDLSVVDPDDGLPWDFFLST